VSRFRGARRRHTGVPWRGTTRPQLQGTETGAQSWQHKGTQHGNATRQPTPPCEQANATPQTQPDPLRTKSKQTPECRARRRRSTSNGSNAVLHVSGSTAPRETHEELTPSPRLRHRLLTLYGRFVTRARTTAAPRASGAPISPTTHLHPVRDILLRGGWRGRLV
jgi:hypothetical protein